MPDEQPTRPGDTAGQAATFRGGVEKVDQTTGSVEATASPPRPKPGPRPAAPGPRGDQPGTGSPTSGTGPAAGPRPTADTGVQKAVPSKAPKKVRARKVKRIVRHIEPWSVLKISVLFYAAVFMIICVASALLWNTARSAGTIENVESFITSVGGFGKCEPIEGATATTTTTAPTTTAPVDQIDPTGTETTVPPEAGVPEDESPDDDDDCREGTELVGEFKFEDGRIFQAFVLGGVVLVLAGTAANVILTLLFNLMSDLTGGVRMTVLEEDPPPRTQRRSGSPPARPRD